MDLKDRSLLLGEINGDGLMDLLVSPKKKDPVYTWAAYNSMGDGQFYKSTFAGTQNSGISTDGFLLQDVTLFVYAELSVFEVGYVELGDAVLVAVFYKEIVLVGDINLVGNVLYFFGIVVYDCIVGLEKVESGVVPVVTSYSGHF